MLSKRIVIIGGGFGGLYAAKNLVKSGAHITLIDKRNFHLFQPLLYQVASGGLSPGDIASPLRAIFKRYQQIETLMAEVLDIDLANKKVKLADRELGFDYLIVATGSTHSYFQHPEWETFAPGLKTIEDALEMRRRIFRAFEQAELCQDPEQRAAWLRFVVIGGGPTGVELAGAIGELAHYTLKNDFRQFQSAETEVLLLEGGPQILSAYPPDLAQAAVRKLNQLGVTVKTKTLLTELDAHQIKVKSGDQVSHIRTETVLWAAGVKASPLGAILAKASGAELDRQGRVQVGSTCALPNHPNVFVIGDLAHYTFKGAPLPGVAPVAMQQGKFVARWIRADLAGKNHPKFRYFDKGNLAVLGRNAAIAKFRRLKFRGFPAWLVWALVHIHYLIEFDNKVLVSLQWGWNFLTRKRGARLISQKSDERS